MQAAQVEGYEVNTTLYMAMELSNKKWKLGFGNGAKIRRKTIDARDRQRCLEEVKLAKVKLKLPADAKVVCCFEAGRDGHWIHRWLESESIEVLEIDSSSIETPRGRKHVKTDRIDVEKLLDLLIRHHCFGLRRAFRVVRVPSVAAEAEQDSPLVLPEHPDAEEEDREESPDDDDHRYRRHGPSLPAGSTRG